MPRRRDQMEPVGSPDIPRRSFLGTLAGGLLAAPLAAEAQPGGEAIAHRCPVESLSSQTRTRRRPSASGFATSATSRDRTSSSTGGINRAGATGLPALAAELVRLKPDVIVADVAAAIRAAKQATSTIPIVMATSADPVGAGSSPASRRPGRNVTGVTIMLAEMTAKRLQLLKEVAPQVSRVAVLWDPAIPWHRAMLKEIEAAAPVVTTPAHRHCGAESRTISGTRSRR